MFTGYEYNGFSGDSLKSKDVARISVFIAMGVAGRVLMLALPNVEPITTITMTSSLLFGVRYGFLIGFFSIFLSDYLAAGVGVWTCFTSLSMGIIGILSGFYGRFRKSPKRFELGILAFFLTLTYDLITNAGWMVIGGIINKKMFLSTILLCYAPPFLCEIHEISNFIFLSAFGPKIIELIRKYS